jgi:hypothetical protein
MIAPHPSESPEDFLERVVIGLGEHFDVIQLFAQTENPEFTDTFNAGKGNILARQKQIENWLEMGGGQEIEEQEEDAHQEEDEDDE